VKNEKSVFIVDPNPFARKGFTHLLRAGDYKISFYASLIEFLEVCDPELTERCKNLSLVNLKKAADT
jgi:FixJ family two-component response regulator